MRIIDVFFLRLSWRDMGLDLEEETETGAFFIYFPKIFRDYITKGPMLVGRGSGRILQLLEP